jgi:putative endopeptidase
MAAATVAALSLLPRSARAQQPAGRGLDRAGMDTTCAACRDFFGFANGTWLKRTEIPAAYTSYGAFTELSDRNQNVLHQALEEAARSSNASTSANTRKVGIFYATCMDSSAIEAAGVRPLQPQLDRIAAIRTPADLQRELARLQLTGVSAMMRIGAGADFKNSSEMILQVGQGGLGLPDRDYYTKDDSASVKIRAAYVDHIGRMFQLLGERSEVARANADRVMAIETALANASMTRVERRDPNAIYHKMTVAELQQLTPHLTWSAILKEMGAPSGGAVNVSQPEFVKALDSMMSRVPLDDWKAYLRWRVVDDAAPSLSSAFVNEDFRMRQVLTGARELLPRWKRCLQATDRSMGEALGQAYVEKTFTPEAKARALEMVRNMEAVLRDRLTSLEWMSEATRQQAIVKLDAIMNKIGYPDKWRDYSALTVARRPFVLNQLAATEFERKRNLAKIGKPVDRSEWGMTPPTVNAYYSPTVNEIVFPAGILQPPFFDPNADPAVNYGGIGAVIGHEMSHQFDDQGAKYDLHGNLVDWWTPADAKNFQSRLDKYEAQINAYEPLPGMHVNGKLTMGENVADLAGVTVAHDAYIASLNGTPPPVIDGFTGDQRFYLGWAQVWRCNDREADTRQRLLTDPHSPCPVRTDVVRNMDPWYSAFGVQPGQKLYLAPADRVRIW